MQHLFKLYSIIEKMKEKANYVSADISVKGKFQ